MITDAWILFTVFGLLFAGGTTFTTYRLAVADALGPIPLWSWTGGAAVVAVVDIGAVYGGLLDLTNGAPSGSRIGWTVAVVVVAVMFAALVFSLAGGDATSPTPRWLRWRLAGCAFTGVMTVSGVVCVFLN
ncbi:hypothetical protein [Streptomyces sp. CL7]|uniref:hypothetical protein n=1 Tax=Streptomyces sp. CL7 TaxID=3096006 RepID=UPI002A749F1B|nr:hypothetical protein [Streptomyces sp. CL7]WPP31435.1 hypothetical protein SJH97_19855 [Streptomyces sp. CL7]